MSDNQREYGHYKLYSYPDKIVDKKNENTERFQKFAIIATNNFNGQIKPKVINIPNRFKEKRELQIGGVAAIKTYSDLLRGHYKEHTLFIDAGSFLNETKDHHHTQFLRNYLNYDAGGIGPGEFQVVPRGSNSFQTYIKSLFSKSDFPLVASNIFDLKKADQITWPKVSDSVVITKSNLKFGLLSVITPESTKNIPDRQVNNLYFQNAAKKILAKSRSLKRKGAQVIIVMANGEFDCTSLLSKQEGIPESKVNFVPFESYHCDIQTNPFHKALELLPAGTVDVIISSGENSKVVNFINDIPVVQNKGDGEYLSWIEMTFDFKHNAIIKTKTKINQPIMLCHQFFKDSLDCFTEEDYEGKELIPASFLGEKVLIKEIPKLPL